MLDYFKNQYTVQANKNLPYYLLSGGFFILMKFAYKFADNNHLAFLLRPTNKMVGVLTGQYSENLQEQGYYYQSLNVLIDKSCAGFNFWVLSFLIFTYLTVRYYDTHIQKTLAVIFAFFGSYLLTLFVNTSRIFASIVVKSQTKDIFLNHQHLIHEAIGVITNLTFLILAYILVEKLLIYKQHNAKFT